MSKTETLGRNGARRSPRPRPERTSESDDQEPLEVLLRGHSREVEAAIAARTALRVAPMMVRDVREARTAADVAAFFVLVSTVFRASALARVTGKYPSRAHGLNAAALVAAARANAAAAVVAQNFARWAVGIAAPALAAAADAADAAAARALAAAPDPAGAAGLFAIPPAAPAQPSFLAAYATADPALRAAARFDISAWGTLGVHGLVDLPLWPRGAADWAEGAWHGLKLVLSGDQGWDVWIDWYEDRLRGGSRGEAYEFVFASVPLDVWDKGPAPANQWIRAHLPKRTDDSRLPESPMWLPGRV